MPNILVTTFGGTWAILPEILSFFQYPDIDIFKNNTFISNFKDELYNLGIDKIDSLWIIHTDNDKTYQAFNLFEKWCEKIANPYIPEIKKISVKGLSDLKSYEDCLYMRELIFRSVLKASEYKGEGKLILSLAGGRKTMSADMQRASDLFGCSLLFHIADNFNISVKNTMWDTLENLSGVLDQKEANYIFPVIINKQVKKNILTEIPSKLKSDNYPVFFSLDNEFVKYKNLINEIENRLRNAESIHFNLYKSRTSNTSQSIFYGLMQLSPDIFNALASDKPDYNWLKNLPKVDLHCHLGGILDVQGMIDVALSLIDEINEYRFSNTEFNNWYNKINDAVINCRDEILREYVHNSNKNYLRNLFPDIKKPIVVAAFLSCFVDKSKYLENLIYGDYIVNKNFRNIGFDAYERLGDLQGSALLQSQKTIRKTCDKLLEYCKDHNIRYLELRCSPCNYTLGGLSERDVIKILHEKLAYQPNLTIKLIIIGSRHANFEIFKKHVDLALKCKQHEEYKNFVTGFDIAGNEASKNPAELREYLKPLMKECVKFTIHAGENQPVENIWQAVYELNADRIGHGLTLIDNPVLMERFKDRNIFIELCPSSNFQICNYNTIEKGKEYPLKYYFENGLKITINTDNPGISRTDITTEYLFASEIAQLSKLDILKLIRNSVQAVFLSKNEKKELLMNIENEIYKLKLINKL